METPCGDGTWFVSVLQMMTNCIFISFCTKFRCPIDMEEVYPVALVSFLAEGGTRKGKRSFDQVNNKKMIVQNLKCWFHVLFFFQWIITRLIGPVDNEVFSNYISNFSPITQETEGRITINYHPGENAPEPPPPEEEDDDEDSGVSLRPSLGFLLAVMLRNLGLV